MTSTFSSLYFLLVNTFFVANIFFNSERKSILLNQFVNRPTTVRLNIHVISCDTYDIIDNHWASLLLSCILHKVWAIAGLTHCYFSDIFFMVKIKREREKMQTIFVLRRAHNMRRMQQKNVYLDFFFLFNIVKKETWLF